MSLGVTRAGGMSRGARLQVLVACAGAALTISVLAISAASPPSFTRARHFATGRGPLDIAIRDLNGDRKPDVVSANAEGTVSVLRGRGDGGLLNRQDYTTGPFPTSLAVADLDRDGKLDLATSNRQGHTVSVLANMGDGRFPTKVDYPVRGASSVAIGDLNGDKRPDLAVGSYLTETSSKLSVLVNMGRGSFEAGGSYTTGSAPNSVAISDLNADGKADAVTANYLDSTVSVLLNNGDGSFRPQVRYPTVGYPVSIAIGDLNGDRKPDLAASGESVEADNVAVFLNRGDGSFLAPRRYFAGREPSAIAIGDLNGDGTRDLATANLEGASVSVLVNRGDATISDRHEYTVGGDPGAVAIGDLNRDGSLDLVADGGTNSVSVLVNKKGLCTVPRLRGKTLQAAKRAILRDHCRLGKVGYGYSNVVRKGRIMSQKPRPATLLPRGSKVSLVVSRGVKSSLRPASRSAQPR